MTKEPDFLCLRKRGMVSRFFFFYEPEASLSTLFLSHSFLCLSHFLLMLFFFDVFLAIPVQIRFQSNGSDIGLARPPIEPLAGTERVDVFFAFSLLRPIFQSDREGISLARPPFVVLTRTNSPCRHLHAPSVPFL